MIKQSAYRVVANRGMRRKAGAYSTQSSFVVKLFSLEGRAAIVTGGGSGIGFSIARGLARAGAAVVIAGRREGILEEACQKIQHQLGQDCNGKKVKVGVPVGFFSCDITDYDQVPSLVKEAGYITGIPPTILINNAGINVRQEANALTSDHWNESMNLMLTAPFMLTRAMVGNMKDAKYGRIINIASLQSFAAFPHSIPYAAAKSGVLGLTRALAEAYSPQYGYPNVTCNALAPGYIKTDLTASVFADDDRSRKLADRTLLGRNSEPDDLVGAAIFLSSPAAAYVTGQTLPVDGGFTALGMR